MTVLDTEPLVIKQDENSDPVRVAFVGVDVGAPAGVAVEFGHIPACYVVTCAVALAVVAVNHLALVGLEPAVACYLARSRCFASEAGCDLPVSMRAALEQC